jgi:hypothetical protein
MSLPPRPGVDQPWGQTRNRRDYQEATTTHPGSGYVESNRQVTPTTRKVARTLGVIVGGTAGGAVLLAVVVLSWVAVFGLIGGLR